MNILNEIAEKTRERIEKDKKEMKILDACCGGKMFWYEKDLPMVTFQDIRAGVGELFVVKG